MIQDRLHNQQLINSHFISPRELVGYMGAIQAQNYTMSKWAIGLRIAGITEIEVEEDLNKGEILRTHILRPTWHIVTAEDIHWMLELTAPRLKKVLQTYMKHVKMSPDIFEKTNKVIRKLLEAGIHCTREEIGIHLETKGFALDNHQLNQTMFESELEGIACSGITKGKQQTYALLENRVPKPSYFDKDEALGKLATKYFQSHSPASVDDFSWWSGLTILDARRAMEIMPKLETVSEKNKIHEASTKSEIILLPAFDEYLVSYKNRDVVLSKENYTKVITSNGIFKPSILWEGKVIGTWKTQTNSKSTKVITEIFQPQSKEIEQAIKIAIDKFQLYKNNLL